MANIQERNHIEGERWSKKYDLIFSSVGYMFEFSGLCLLPYFCDRNGGVLFIIVYTLLYSLIGIPMVYMKMAMGQYFQSGEISGFRKISPFCAGIGYASLIIGFLTMIKVNGIATQAARFLVKIFLEPNLPWESCDNYWNTPNCYTGFTSELSNTNYSSFFNENTDIRSPHQEYYEVFFNGNQPPLLLNYTSSICMFSIYIIAYLISWKGIKTIGKIFRVTAFIPYIMFLVLLIIGLQLPGALNGMKEILTPDFEELFNMRFLFDASMRIFYLHGLKFGVIMAFSSYNNHRNNIQSDALVVDTINLAGIFISILLGCCLVGYINTVTNSSINFIMTIGHAVSFVLFPLVFSQIQYTRIWLTLFYLAHFIVGINVTVGISEAILKGLSDEFLFIKINRKKSLLVLYILANSVGLVFCNYGAIERISIFEMIFTVGPLFVIILIKLNILIWFYGMKRLHQNIYEMIKINRYVIIFWGIVTNILLILVLIEVYSNVTRFIGYQGTHWVINLSGCVLQGLFISVIPGYALYNYFKTRNIRPIKQSLSIDNASNKRNENFEFYERV